MLKTGTKVLVENTSQKDRKGGKWDCRYKGPYIIQESLGKGIYSLKKIDGTVLKNKFNINRLKVTLTLFLIFLFVIQDFFFLRFTWIGLCPKMI